MTTQLNSGEIIKKYFEIKRIRRAALSRSLGKTLKSVLNYEKNTTIQTRILWELSHALKHNFFMDIALLLPPDFETTQDVFMEKDKIIIELKNENEMLKREKELLVNLIKK